MVQVKYYSYGTGQSYITMPIKTAREIGIEHLDELELEIQEIEGKKRVILTPIKRRCRETFVILTHHRLLPGVFDHSQNSDSIGFNLFDSFRVG